MTSSMPSPRDEVDSPEVSARIQAGLARVPGIVRQMKDHLALHARRDDLTSFGNEGALIAARTYDPDYGVPFDRWATLKVRGAIIDGLRVQTDLPRRLYDRLRARCGRGLGGRRDDARRPRVRSPRERGRRRHEDRRPPRRHGRRLRRRRVHGARRRDTRVDRGHARDAGGRARPPGVEGRSPRRHRRASGDDERMLLERYYFQDATMAEAAGGLSRSWASRLHARAISGVARSLARARKMP